jgi:hypothetical protein
MAANTFWNYLYFRRRDFRLVFWYSVGYSILVAGLVCVLLYTDAAVAIAFGGYAAYLIYALALFYSGWKLNS